MSYSTTLPALAVNVAAIATLAYAIYYRRHRRRDLLGAYVALNLGVFCAVTLLATQDVGVGLAFGLFGILSIVRLRSSSITQEEVGYYFVALTLGLVNGLGAGGLGVSIVLDAVLLGGMFVADHPRVAARVERRSVLLNGVYPDNAELHADLERRLAGEVLRCVVTDVDYVAGTTRCDVRFRAARARAKYRNRSRPNGPGGGVPTGRHDSPTDRRATAAGRADQTPRPDRSCPMTNVLHMSPSPFGVADRAVSEAAVRATGVSLPEVLARAALQTRWDRKYLIDVDELARLTAQLGGELEALEIDGRRTFAYESQYFDTPHLLTYHEHLADRSDRFKVRTRSYLDSGETMFEVKLEGPEGGTIKRRVGHSFDDRARITSGARVHLAAALTESARSVPDDLGASAMIGYRRSTFVLRDGSARITCDRSLVASDGTRSVTGLADHVLVEVKSGATDSTVDRALARLGREPVSISKYCVGLALLRPELASDPWDPVLERYFARPPALVAA